jgi:hypothetical protein
MTAWWSSCSGTSSTLRNLPRNGLAGMTKTAKRKMKRKMLKWENGRKTRGRKIMRNADLKWGRTADYGLLTTGLMDPKGSRLKGFNWGSRLKTKLHCGLRRFDGLTDRGRLGGSL